MKRHLPILVAFGVGFLFAVGLGISGMTQPQKVIGFLDVFGEWDSSLLWVMVGAIAVHALVYRLSRLRQRPVFSEKWHLPTRKDITFDLVAGSALFGMGWALAGYCPGPALTSLGAGQNSAIVFVISMIFGMLAHRLSR